MAIGGPTLFEQTLRFRYALQDRQAIEDARRVQADAQEQSRQDAHWERMMSLTEKAFQEREKAFDRGMKIAQLQTEQAVKLGEAPPAFKDPRYQQAAQFTQRELQIQQDEAQRQALAKQLAERQKAEATFFRSEPRAILASPAETQARHPSIAAYAPFDAAEEFEKAEQRRARDARAEERLRLSKQRLALLRKFAGAGSPKAHAKAAKDAVDFAQSNAMQELRTAESALARAEKEYSRAQISGQQLQAAREKVELAKERAAKIGQKSHEVMTTPQGEASKRSFMDLYNLIYPIEEEFPDMGAPAEQPSLPSEEEGLDLGQALDLLGGQLGR